MSQGRNISTEIDRLINNTNTNPNTNAAINTTNHNKINANSSNNTNTNPNFNANSITNNNNKINSHRSLIEVFSIG